MSDTLQVSDLGNRRRVVVSNGSRTTEFETSLSADLVRRFFAAKGGEWMKDAIDRTEDPGIPSASLLQNFGPCFRKI